VGHGPDRYLTILEVLSFNIMGLYIEKAIYFVTGPNNCVIFRTISEGPDIVLGHA
jgi:hypothetical protein